MIFSGALYIGRNNSKAIDSVLAHTFLELERQVEEARKNALSGPLIGMDGRPLTIDGKEIESQEAIKNWTLYTSKLKAESSRLALRAEAERHRNNSSARTGMGSNDRRSSHSGWGRRISMVLGHVPEPLMETLTDEDLAEIYALNNKVTIHYDQMIVINININNNNNNIIIIVVIISISDAFTYLRSCSHIQHTVEAWQCCTSCVRTVDFINAV
jgi:hypothetical protein